MKSLLLAILLTHAPLSAWVYTVENRTDHDFHWYVLPNSIELDAGLMHRSSQYLVGNAFQSWAHTSLSDSFSHYTISRPEVASIELNIHVVSGEDGLVRIACDTVIYPGSRVVIYENGPDVLCRVAGFSRSGLSPR